MLNFAPTVCGKELKPLTRGTKIDSDGLYTLWSRMTPWECGRWFCEETLRVGAGQTWEQAYILKHKKMPDAKLLCFLEE